MKELIVRLNEGRSRPGERRTDELAIETNLEEALFTSSRHYASFQENADEITTQSRRMLGLLSDSLPSVSDDFQWSLWDARASDLLKFVVGPLRAAAFAAEVAAGDSPTHVKPLPGYLRPGWWTGRDCSLALADYVAEITDAHLVREPLFWKIVRAHRPEPRIGHHRLLLRMLRSRRVGNRDRPNPCDVLFLLEGPTLVPFYESLSDVLEDDYGLKCGAIALVDLGRGNEGWIKQSDFSTFYSFATTAGRRKAIRASSEGLGTASELELAVRASGLLGSLPSALHEVLLRRLKFFRIAELPDTLNDAFIWKELLTLMAPRAIVGFNAYSKLLSPAVLIARDLNIDTICCQHGIWGPTLEASILMPYSRIAVFGSFGAETLRAILPDNSHGIEFEVTGNPLYDHYSPREAAAGAGMTILAATQPVEGYLRQQESWWWLETLAKVCTSEGRQLVIKTHPAENDLSSYEALSRDNPQTVMVVCHGQRDLTELIRECALLVTRYSTVVMEAAVQGRPSVVVYPQASPERYPFAEEGVATAVSSPNELRNAIIWLLHEHTASQERKRETFLDRHVGPVDGKARDRIASFIAKPRTEP